MMRCRCERSRDPSADSRPSAWRSLFHFSQQTNIRPDNERIWPKTRSRVCGKDDEHSCDTGCGGVFPCKVWALGQWQRKLQEHLQGEARATSGVFVGILFEPCSRPSQVCWAFGKRVNQGQNQCPARASTHQVVLRDWSVPLGALFVVLTLFAFGSTLLSDSHDSSF